MPALRFSGCWRNSRITALNESILRELLAPFGFGWTRDQVRGEITWLAEQGLVTIETVAELMVAKITGAATKWPPGAPPRPASSVRVHEASGGQGWCGGWLPRAARGCGRRSMKWAANPRSRACRPR